MPPDVRRSLLYAATRIAAPAARPPGPPGLEPVIVVGPISSATGLGEGARLSIRALRDGGLDVRGVDISPVMLGGDPAEPIDHGPPAQSGPGTVVLHVSAPLAPLALLALLALLMLGRRTLRGKRIIGYFAWELPDLPPDWVAARPHVHEIWVPSRFNAEAFRRHTDRLVHVVPHPVTASDRGEFRHGETGDPFTALTPFNMASGFARKNPVAAVRAFRLAFPSGGTRSARLVLKTHHADAYPAGAAELAEAIDSDPRITIIDSTLDRSDLNALVAGSDTVMLLHRSEGFGLPLAEAMGLAVPVVGTNWSGNTDFMDIGNSCPVSFRLVPAIDPQGTYDHPWQSWADPCIEDAARHLRLLHDNPDMRTSLGCRAAETIRQRLSRAAYAARVRSLLSIVEKP
jgi:glycosyltransferase involved in cell wall biosynthesis